METDEIKRILENLLLEPNPSQFKLTINKDYFSYLEYYKWGYIIDCYNEVCFSFLDDNVIYKKEDILHGEKGNESIG